MSKKRNDHPQRGKRRIWRYIGIVALCLLVIFVVSASIWLIPSGATATAQKALQSDSQVEVTNTNDYIAFIPRTKKTTGFIFYPGGKVDPVAYAPYMHHLAKNGYLTFIVKVLLNLALFDSHKADVVIKSHPEVKTWALGGHSLGGVAAAEYVKENVTSIKGLVFYGSYPNSDLSQLKDLTVVSLYGTQDGLATPAKVLASKPLLPATTTFVPIEGGIHAYFGDYGDQSGDGKPTISREQAQKIINEENVKFMQSLE